MFLYQENVRHDLLILKQKALLVKKSARKVENLCTECGKVARHPALVSCNHIVCLLCLPHRESSNIRQYKCRGCNTLQRQISDFNRFVLSDVPYSSTFSILVASEKAEKREAELKRAKAEREAKSEEEKLNKMYQFEYYNDLLSFVERVYSEQRSS